MQCVYNGGGTKLINNIFCSPKLDLNGATSRQVHLVACCSAIHQDVPNLPFVLPGTQAIHSM